MTHYCGYSHLSITDGDLTVVLFHYPLISEEDYVMGLVTVITPRLAHATDFEVQIGVVLANYEQLVLWVKRLNLLHLIKLSFHSFRIPLILNKMFFRLFLETELKLQLSLEWVILFGRFSVDLLSTFVWKRVRVPALPPPAFLSSYLRPAAHMWIEWKASWKFFE